MIGGFYLLCIRVSENEPRKCQRQADGSRVFGGERLFLPSDGALKQSASEDSAGRTKPSHTHTPNTINTIRSSARRVKIDGIKQIIGRLFGG